MDKREAIALLRDEVRLYRDLPFESLQTLLSRSITSVRTGPSGKDYQLETQVMWDDRPGGNLRVTIAIDDGGLAAFVPLTEDFILSPTGAFIDEDN